jgi:hypothetical protein
LQNSSVDHDFMLKFNANFSIMVTVLKLIVVELKFAENGGQPEQRMSLAGASLCLPFIYDLVIIVHITKIKSINVECWS